MTPDEVLDALTATVDNDYDDELDVFWGAGRNAAGQYIVKVTDTEGDELGTFVLEARRVK